MGHSGGPGNEHDERSSSEGEGGGEPWIRKRIENLLVVDIKDDVQSPPSGEIEADFEFLSGAFIGKLDVNVKRAGVGLKCPALSGTRRRKILNGRDVKRFPGGKRAIVKLMV